MRKMTRRSKNVEADLGGKGRSGQHRKPVRQKIGKWVRAGDSTVYIEATDHGICRLDLESQRKVKSYRRGHSSGRMPRARRLLRQTEKSMIRYFQGKPVDFSNTKVDTTFCTVFQKRVLNRLRHVRWGRVVSYAALAKLAGQPRAYRAVGTVLNKNRIPIVLPCHRVIREDGSIGRYSGGLIWKKKLLDLEKLCNDPAASA